MSKPEPLTSKILADLLERGIHDPWDAGLADSIRTALIHAREHVEAALLVAIQADRRDAVDGLETARAEFQDTIDRLVTAIERWEADEERRAQQKTALLLGYPYEDRAA